MRVEQPGLRGPVVIAVGKRPVSFRTRKLSPPAPMVLLGRLGGRVGHRRIAPLGGGGEQENS